MEGRVYNCTWTKEGNLFRVWVASNPRLSAEANTLAEADERLWSVICDRFGDGENVREYQPPFPPAKADDAYLADGLVTLVGNSRAEQVGSLEPLFTEGLCKECGAGLGERTDAPLEVGFIESGFDSAFIILSNVSFYLYSEDFRSLLRPEESERFVWTPVRRKKGARKAFFECVGIQSVPFVTIRDRGLSGWECGECGNRVFLISRKEFSFSHAVCATGLRHPIPSCFPVGPGIGAEVCVMQERWLSMRGKSGTRGVVAGPLAVVLPGEAEFAPNLPKRFLSREGYRPMRNLK